MGVTRACKSELGAVKALYYIMQSMEGKLGGGEGIEGLYGSITRSGMQKILDCLAVSCNLTHQSHIIDIGAGLGRPLLHALVHPGVGAASGIEIDRIKCNKAAAFLKYSVAELSKRTGAKPLIVPSVECSSIEKVKSLEPGTHAYSFWEGVPVEGKCAFGRLFATSKTMKSVAVVQRAIRRGEPVTEMEEMGFGPLTLVKSFPVCMSGSGRSFTAYIFNKQDERHDVTAQPAMSQPMPHTPSIADGKSKISTCSDALCLPDSPADSATSSIAIAAPKFGTHLQHENGRTDKEYPSGEDLTGLRSVLTPAGVNERPGITPSTPTSLGNLGPARRVPACQVHGGKSLAEMKPPIEPETSREKAHHDKQQLPAGLLRRSSRHKAVSHVAASLLRAALTQEKASLIKCSPPTKGVQKAQSPQKTIESLGFRSRRAVLPRKGKHLDFAGKSIKPRGLAASPQKSAEMPHGNGARICHSGVDVGLT